MNTELTARPSNANSRVVAVLARYRWDTAASQAALVVAATQAWALLGLPGSSALLGWISVAVSVAPFGHPIARSAPVLGRRHEHRLRRLIRRVDNLAPWWTCTTEGSQAIDLLRTAQCRTVSQHRLHLDSLTAAYHVLGKAAEAAKAEIKNQGPGAALEPDVPCELTKVCQGLRALGRDAGIDIANDERWRRL